MATSWQRAALGPLLCRDGSANNRGGRGKISAALASIVLIALTGDAAPAFGQDRDTDRPPATHVNEVAPAAESRSQLPLVVRSADPQAMAARIDELLERRWLEAGAEPAPPADDAEFLRRVYLDLTGVIPTVHQARRFLEDQSPDKRVRLIQSLLVSPSYATHLATTWRNRLLPSDFDPVQLNRAAGLQNWLQERFAENLRFDQLVRRFLVATGTGERGPGIYYTSLGLQPEKLAASTARIFLGLQLQCAECHEHPHDNWSQEEFWGFAAFFAQLAQSEPDEYGMALLIDRDDGEVRIPGTGDIVPPRYLKDRLADPAEGGTRRQQLAIWMVSPSNPFTARAAVNWAWYHLFGRGIVHPVDDFSSINPPSHPRLLDELTAYFVHSGYDLRLLLETLTRTRAYQLSSLSPESIRDPALFDRMALKVMSPEQLYDCLHQSLWRPAGSEASSSSDLLQDARRIEFISRMASLRADVTDYEYGLPQALMLLNGPETNEAADITRSRLLLALSAPFLDTDQQLDILFLAIVSRWPSEDERATCREFLDRCETDQERRAVLGDIVWALLNSAEFCVNH